MNAQRPRDVPGTCYILPVLSVTVSSGVNVISCEKLDLIVSHASTVCLQNIATRVEKLLA